jgi:fumarate reductase subunit D
MPRCNAECSIFTVTLSGIMLSAIRLNVVVLLVAAPLELGMVLANHFG